MQENFNIEIKLLFKVHCFHFLFNLEKILQTFLSALCAVLEVSFGVK